MLNIRRIRNIITMAVITILVGAVLPIIKVSKKKKEEEPPTFI